MFEFIDTSNNTPQQQFGFRPGHLTIHNVLQISEWVIVYKVLNEGNILLLLFFT